MKYILEIRDLTNEERELKSVRKDYTITVDSLTKNVETLATNHVTAMGEYLNLMHQQILKITTHLYVDNIYAVRCNFTPTSIVVSIQIGGYLRTFSYHKEHGLVEKDTNTPLSNLAYKDYLLALMHNWDAFKQTINGKIESCIASQSKQMATKVDEMEYMKKRLESFTI